SGTLLTTPIVSTRTTRPTATAVITTPAAVATTRTPAIAAAAMAVAKTGTTQVFQVPSPFQGLEGYNSATTRARPHNEQRPAAPPAKGGSTSITPFSRRATSAGSRRPTGSSSTSRDQMPNRRVNAV